MNRTKQSVQRELKQQVANLNVIEEKIAEFTELEAPVHLITQRDKTRQHIEELKEMLHTGNQMRASGFICHLVLGNIVVE